MGAATESARCGPSCLSLLPPTTFLMGLGEHTSNLELLQCSGFLTVWERPRVWMKVVMLRRVRFYRGESGWESGGPWLATNIDLLWLIISAMQSHWKWRIWPTFLVGTNVDHRWTTNCTTTNKLELFVLLMCFHHDAIRNLQRQHRISIYSTRSILWLALNLLSFSLSSLLALFFPLLFLFCSQLSYLCMNFISC